MSQNPPTAHLSARQRADLIELVQVQHYTLQAVAERLSVSRQTVSNVLKKFRDTGEIEEVHSGGRPSALSAQDERKLNKLLRDHPSARSEDIVEMMGAAAPRISARTVRRRREALPYTRRTGRPWVERTESQQQRFHEFCVQHKTSDLKTWVFLDESTFQLRDTGPVLWVPRGQPTPPHIISNLRCAIHMWGAVWWEGAVFARYEGHLDATRYRQLLEDNLSRYKRKLIRRSIAEDNVSYHAAGTVTEWFEEHKMTVLDWPPYSSEINAIEGCWAWIKLWVITKHPHTPAELCKQIDCAFLLLPEKVRQNHMLHCQNLIRAEAAG